MAKDNEQSVVNPWELDWNNVNVKQDSQSFGRKAKDLGGFVVDRGRDVTGGLMKGVVGVGRALKGVYDFVDTNTDGGLAITPVGYGLKVLDAVTGQNNYQNAVNSQKQGRQKAMNAINSYVDNSDGFAGDYLRALGFGDSTQDTKGFGNSVQNAITNHWQSQGMRDQLARRQEQNALETRRWDSLPESEKTFGKRLGHYGIYAKNALNNPLATMDDVVVSGSEMATGGSVLKGVNFGLKALQGTKAGAKAVKALGGEGAVKAGLTEGLIAGGHAVADVKSELGDDFDKTAANKAGLVGLTTGAISLGGNRLGRALGIADIDEMLIAGAKNTAKGTGGKLGRLGAVAKGAVQEGLLEELPQGMAETALQNWATGKPITEGMAENAISGAIAGGLMGGSGAGLHYQATPDKGFGFSPASRVKPKEMKKYADSIERQRQALAKNIYSIYGDPTDLDSEDARINQHISRQAQQGYGLGVLGQREVDMSAMQHYNTPSTLLGLRRDYQGGGALENTAALAVDSGVSPRLDFSNRKIATTAPQSRNDGYLQGSLLPQSQLGDDLMNTPIDDSVISSRSSGSVVKGATGRKGGSTGATGGNITISNPTKTRLDGLQGFGSGQTITNSNTLKTPTQYTAKEQETIRRIESTPNKGRDMAVIGRDNLTPAILDYAVSNNRSIAVDTLAPKKAIALGYKHTDDVRRTISGSAITHTLNRHGKDSDLAKKGQKPVTKQHIQNWAKYADNADMQVITKDNLNQEVVISGKQINGYHLVVESIRKKGNELAFKTMYFEKGDLKNNENFKDAQTLLRGYEPDANSFASLKVKDKSKPNSDNVSANHHAGYEPATQLGVGNSNRLKNPVAGSGTLSNSAYGQTVVSRNPTLSQMPQQGKPVNQTIANTIPQTKPLINQGFSASESSVKQGVKQSPRLKANLRRQFNTAENRVQLDRQKVLNTPDLSAHAKRISKENIIPINANSKEEALKVRDIYGWDKTHTPLQEAASGKWHLVKNTAWNKAKAEQAMVSDAVAKVQAAVSKVSSEKLAVSSLDAKKAKQPNQTAKNTQNETKNAVILGSKAKITAKNDKILQKTAEKRGDKAKSQRVKHISDFVAKSDLREEDKQVFSSLTDKEKYIISTIIDDNTEEQVIQFNKLSISPIGSTVRRVATAYKKYAGNTKPTYGKRQGLEKLPDIPVVRLNGNEFDAETLKDMQKLADDFLRVLQASKTPLHNDEQNWDLSISKIDRKKMGDNENLPKHTTQAVAGIRDLAKNAVLVESHEDAKHSNPDVIAIHRLYAPVQIGDTLYRAKLTVKDYSQKDGNQFKNLHAIETVEIEKETAGLGTLPTAKQSVQKSAQPTTLRDTVSISQLLQNAKSDIDGKPLIDEKNQLSVSNKSVSQSKKAKDDKQDKVSGSLKSEKQGISASEKGNGKTIHDAVILPDGAIQLQIGGEWYHENALSYSNFEQINKIASQLNHSDLDILKLKAFRRSYQRNIGDKNSEIYQNASKYNDNHDRKSHRRNRGELENFAQVVARVDTALKEIANSGSLKNTESDTSNNKIATTATQSRNDGRGSGSLKQQKQQETAQALYSKANEIRKAKKYPETAKKVKEAVVKAVGEKNLKHISVIPYAKAVELDSAILSLNGIPEGMWIEDKKQIALVIEAFAEDPQLAAFVAWHELGHRGIGVQGRNAWRKVLRYYGKNNLLIGQVARRFYDQYRSQGITDFTIDDALEECFVDLYGAYKTGDWATFEQRNGIKIPDSVKKYGDRNVIQRLWNELKAIVSRIFGIQSQALSDKQMFALLRGLDGVAGYEFDPKQGSLKGERRYSLSEKVDSNFAKAVDAIAKGGYWGGKFVRLGTTPDAFVLAGMPKNAPVEIDKRVIDKVMDGKHLIDAKTLKRLPEQLNNPIAILKSSPKSTNPDGFVVLTELMERNDYTNKDMPIVVSLFVKEVGGNLEVVKISSVYGKDGGKASIANFLNRDKVLYWDKNKGSQYLNSLGLYLPPRLNSDENLVKHNIKTNDDLSQAKTRFSLASNNGVRYSLKPFNPATVKPATDAQIKQAVVTPKRQAVNSEQAKEQANAFLRKELINKHSGLPATVHNSNLRKMISNSAAMKSINPQLHALAIANVDELYQNAIYGWRKTDRDNSPDIAGIHRLFATLRTEQGDFVVKMTVKEYTQPEQNNALYTVEALEVETQENSPAYNSVKQLLEHDKIGGNYSTNTTGAIESLIKNVQEVNKNQAKTRFSLASNNKAIARINANTVRNITEKSDFEWLEEAFANNWEDGEIRPQHAKLFAIAKNSKTIKAFQAALKSIKSALRFSEIPHGKEELNTFSDFFENVEELQDLKQYSKEDLQAIADNANFQAWFKDAHKAFRNTDGTPKVFYRGMTDIDQSDIQSLETNANNNDYGAEFYTDNAIQAETYFNQDGYIQQVAINTEKPFVMPHTSGKDFSSLMKDYTVSQAVRLFKMAGFDTKPTNWDKLSVTPNMIEDFSTTKNTITFYLQTGEKTGYQLTLDKNPSVAMAMKKFSDISTFTDYSTNFFVRNLQSRGKFDSVVFKNIYDTGWQFDGDRENSPQGTVLAVWGTKDNQAYAKELGNKGSFSKEDKRIFYSLKNAKPEPIPAFGENFDEYYHKGQQAVEKLLKEKHGQVVGAFYKDGIGDITLAWGVAGTGKSDGWGLAKIAQYHPEMLNQLEQAIHNTPIVKTTDGRYQLENAKYKIGIRREFDGVRQNWILTAFERNQGKENGGTSNSTTDFVRTTANATGKTAPVSNTANAVTDIKAQSVPNGKTRFSLNTTQSEFDETAKKYGGEQAYKQAKESGKTALTYKQWVQVRTPSFKAWFGDWENDPENASEVVNPDTGEPLVVYHGTTIQGRRFFQFNTEKPAWFSTYKGYAQAFISDKGKPALYTAFLNVRNPVNVGNIDGTVTENSLSTLSEKTGVDISILRKIYDESKGINIFNITNSQQLKSILAKQGVDSISAIEGKVKSFGVFSPEQIKSATENKGSFDGSNPDIRFSLSPQKSVQANITRGKKAMNKALTDGTDVHRAMYRNDIGWVDFVYGDKNKGLLHIIHRRMTADKMTKAEVIKMLTVDIIDTIAQGKTIKHTIADKGERLQVQYNGHQATLVKRKGGNAWVLTGFIEYEKLQTMKQVRVATNSALRTAKPILSRQGVGASDTQNVANSMPTVKQLSGSLKAIKEVVGQDTYDLIHTMIRAENAYGQDETNPQILYSIAKTAEKARLSFGKQLGDMAKETYGKVRTPLMKVKKSKLFPSGWRVALGNKWKDSLNVQLQFLGRRHIVDIFDRVFDGRLKAYSNLVSDMDAMKNALSQKHDDLVRDWGKLPAEENDRLVALMHKATLAQYDPDTKDGNINYKANWNNKVVKNLDEVKALHRDFAKLSPDAKRIYRQVRDNYKEHYNRVRQAMVERIERMTADVGDEQRRAIVEKMNNHFDDGLQGVYFPLQRFGDYVVVAKDKMGKTISVSRAERASQAEEIRREYLRDFPKDKGYSVLPVQLSKDYVQSRDGAGRAFVQNLIGEFANRPDLLDGNQFDEVADIVEQMWIASMPDLSWAKHGIHRKGTAGYSEKARRAYAANMIHGTNYLARLTYSDQLQTALDGMQEFIDNNAANEEFNHIVAQRVQNEMEKRHENLMRPNSHPLATKLTGLGFVWYLGLSPASALVNVTQTWLVGLPIIAAKYQGNNKNFTDVKGWKDDTVALFRVASELFKASKQTAKGWKGNPFTHWNDWTFDISGSLNADEKAAFDRAVKDGTIDTSQAYDLAGIADGHEDAVYFKYQRFMRGVAKMFHEAEVFNRQATFIAVYRLARQKGMTSEAAYQEAKDLTYKSHFDYATSNRARVLQGNWQRVIFLFKQFGFNMLYTVYRNAYVGFLTGIAGTKNNYTAEERKQARRAVLSMGVAHFAVAGILGLPLVGTVLSAITMLAHAGGADDDWDAEKELKQAFASVFGKKGGNAMSYGLARLAGVDLHGRLGLNSLIFPDVQENLEGQDWAESFTVGMSGAVVGMGVNFAKGLNQVHNGEVLKGAESMLPTAVRNGIKSYRLATQGQIDRTGVVVKDDFNAAEIATTAIGFNPASLRRAMEAKSAILNTENRKNKARTALMSAFAKAMMDRDAKAVKEIGEKINEWNKKNPYRRITANNLQQSIRNRRRRITNAKHGVYLSDSHQDTYDEVDYAIVD